MELPEGGVNIITRLSHIDKERNWELCANVNNVLATVFHYSIKYYFESKQNEILSNPRVRFDV